jgi:hypothetical protein
LPEDPAFLIALFVRAPFLCFAVGLFVLPPPCTLGLRGDLRPVDLLSLGLFALLRLVADQYLCEDAVFRAGLAAFRDCLFW